MTFQTDLRYRPDSDRGLLDVMIPDGTGPFPVVVCIHGGGWAGGNKDMLYSYGEHLERMGIASVFPLYRVTGAHPHPEQEEDIFAVLGWVAYHSPEHRFDIVRIGLTGASAGGHLTALIGLKASKIRSLPYTIRCILPVCAPMNFETFVRDSPGIRDVVEALLGGKLEDKPEAVRDLSPISHVHGGAPPCLCTHGASDGVVPQTQPLEFVDALKKAGVEAQAIIVPGADHVFLMPGVEPAEPLGGLGPFQEFFRKHLLAKEIGFVAR